MDADQFSGNRNFATFSDTTNERHLSFWGLFEMKAGGEGVCLRKQAWLKMDGMFIFY